MLLEFLAQHQQVVLTFTQPSPRLRELRRAHFERFEHRPDPGDRRLRNLKSTPDALQNGLAVFVVRGSEAD
jgi:hypothetical protein